MTMTKSLGKSWEDWLLEQGEARGEARGEAKGRLEARRDDLRKALQHRFGKVPKKVLRRIDAMTDPDRIQACLLQVFDIHSIDDLEL
jgi:predicted transposase YdaD